MRNRTVLLSALMVFAALVCAGAYGLFFDAPTAEAVALENCGLTLGKAPGPCSFGGLVVPPPCPVPLVGGALCPCIGTGFFLGMILADVGAAAVPLQIVVGPSVPPYLDTGMILHPGQFVLGVAEGSVGRCLLSPHNLISGLPETGAPLSWPAAYYGESL
ncbi:MAG: hypothetical protein ACREGH_00710 [Minisyncoccia bacterium]